MIPLRYHVWRELRHSSSGQPDYFWKFMPRFSDVFLRSVIYLYPSAEAADTGAASGGTGFLVSIESEAHSDEFLHLYAITNYHVVKEFASPVIRYNSPRGKTSNKELTAAEWIPHPEADVAATYLGYFDPTKYDHHTIGLNKGFVTKAMVELFDIGPGDDVFVPGRFITHGGMQRNEPLLRSGIISMMPSEAMVDHNDHPQECFLVEIRALKGSSGSPVLVQFKQMSGRQTNDLELSEDEHESKRIWQHRHFSTGELLLGIAFADVPYEEAVIERGEIEDKPTNFIVQSNSGLTAVIPAWKISDLLFNDERFKAARQRNDEETTERRRRSLLRPIANT